MTRLSIFSQRQDAGGGLSLVDSKAARDDRIGKGGMDAAKALWCNMERGTKYEGEGREIRAINILSDAEIESVDPRERALLIRRRLEIMNAWDDVEDVLFLLLRNLDSLQKDKK
jgi:hypothetical protein